VREQIINTPPTLNYSHYVPQLQLGNRTNTITKVKDPKQGDKPAKWFDDMFDATVE
jgi:hypothetical protein